MNIWQTFVKRFHDAFGHPAPLTPSFDHARIDLRIKLMDEELSETIEAMHAKDMVKTVDGLADLMYVVLGTAVELGVDMEQVFELVQGANMAKLGKDGKPITRADGKTLKPEGWRPADEAIEQELLRLGWARPYNG